MPHPNYFTSKRHNLKIYLQTTVKKKKQTCNKDGGQKESREHRGRKEEQNS